MFSPASIRQFLDSSFTGRATALSELMQNARRAGATRINITYSETSDTLTFEDDGCGIDSVAVLLTPGESGWNEQVQADDKPFGLGFRAALLNCAHVAVSSKFGRFECDTALLLDGLDPIIEPGDFSVTTITLHHPKIPNIRKHIRELAAAFPIPVLVNGTAVNDPEQWQVVEDNERFTLRMRSGQYPVHSSRQRSVLVTVQGLPVNIPSGLITGGIHPSGRDHHVYGTEMWTMELKDAEARVPDRDALRNAEDVAPYDLFPALAAVARGNHGYDTITAIASIHDGLADVVGAAHGLYRQRTYTSHHDGHAELQGSDDTPYSHCIEWVQRGAPAYRNVPVDLYCNEEESMALNTWLGLVDEESFTPRCEVSAPAMPDVDLVMDVQAEGEVYLDLPHGYAWRRIVLCEKIALTLTYVDDDSGFVVNTLDTVYPNYLNDARNGTIWLTRAGYDEPLYSLARQFSSHIDEARTEQSDGSYIHWDDEDINDFVSRLRAVIELGLRGTAALQDLATSNRNALPSGVVATYRAGTSTAAALCDPQGTILPEGITRFVQEWPLLAAAIATEVIGESKPMPSDKPE